MPPDLVAMLRRVRALEAVTLDTSGGLRGQRRALAATGALMLAAVEAGWRRIEIARALGMKRQAVESRVKVARARYGEHVPALRVRPPAIPPREPDRLAILRQPLEEREWMKVSEAIDFAGASDSTLRNWLRDGLLPNTDRSRGTHLLLRADVVRVMNAARTDARGVNHAALRAAILNRG